MSGIREWLAWHSIRKHIVAPIWVRIPEKQRWRIVHVLNKSDRYCWSDLVDDALSRPESDHCDTHTPTLAKTSTRCGSVCDWMHPGIHSGEHACSCYCGKFQFTANVGALSRQILCDFTAPNRLPCTSRVDDHPAMHYTSDGRCWDMDGAA